MTQSFNPKFVDLVRVNCSTQGQGPLACGPAVPGFSSFAEALLVGDTFYYSVQGIDKPEEREVGRGTYESDNTISRQPLKGALTNFTSGNKIVALVAASEWYARVQQSSTAAGGQTTVASRTALKALSNVVAGDLRTVTEPGRGGLFQWDPAVPVTTHQADPSEGVYVAPNAAAAGAWVRQFSGAIRPEWWGAKADFSGSATGATDNLPPFNAMFLWMKTRPHFQWAGGQSSFKVELGHGRYYFSGALLCRNAKTFVMEGKGGGWRGGAPATQLVFAANSKGLVFDRADTLNDAIDTTTHFDGRGNDGSSIRDFALFSLGGTGTTSHGIQARCQIFAQDITIEQFKGTGIYIVANGNTDPAATRGNANCWMLTNCSIFNCHEGVRVFGQDTNQGSMVGGEASFNASHGVVANCFLGSNFIGVHTNANGGRPFYDLNGTSLFNFCYSEGGQGANNHLNGGLAFGGLQGQEFDSGQHIYADNGMLRTNGGYYCRKLDGATTYNVAIRAGVADFLSAGRDGGVASFTMRWFGTGGAGNEDSVAIGYGYGSNPAALLQSPTATFGNPGGFNFSKIAIGSNLNGIILSSNDSKPSDGGRLGELRLFKGAAFGDPIGWRCTAAHPSAATWEETYGGPKKVVSAAIAGGNLTVGAAQGWTHQRVGAAAAIVLPTDASVPFPVGMEIEFEQTGAADVTLPVTGSGITVLVRGAVTKGAGQNALFGLRKVAANTWLAYGDLA